jgi:hypothetical protein
MAERRWLSLALASALLLGNGLTLAQGPGNKLGREESSFGTLRNPDAAEVRRQAEIWLAGIKKDAVTQEQFKQIWESERSILDKVSATLALGDAAAARLLEEARNSEAPAPTEIPALLKDKSKPAFYRNNLTLAYAKALTTRKVYEEALEALSSLKPEEVVDPPALLFHKAVCEYELMAKDKADSTIDRLLVDAVDAPERYRMVAALMHFDMLTWREKDLGWIARKMEVIQRRLDLKRGGKQTQKIQKEVLVRLDEMIKELENQQKNSGGGSDPNGGGCPNDGQQPGNGPGQDKSSSPQRDTQGGTANGSGQVDAKKVKELAEVWGKLPEKERARAMQELTRNLSARDRAVIESYLKELQKRSSK